MSIFEYSASHAHLLIWFCTSIKVKIVIIILCFVSFIVDQHIIEQQSNPLKRFEKKLKNRLKRDPQVVLEITDNLIEYGILDIDEVEQILHSPKGPHELVVEFINTNIHLGAYNPLLQTLKSEKKLEDLASDLTTAGVSEDIKTDTLYYYN